MTASKRASALTAAALLALFALVAIAFATPARADCTPGGVADPVLCPSPTPTPTPTSSPNPTSSPKPSPSPQPSQNPTPGPQPTFSFPPFPTGFPTALPTYPPGGSPGFNQGPPFNQGMPTPPPNFGDLAAGTARGLAAQPGAADGGFLARAGLLFLIATGVAGWLWRARVRRWMIGV